VKIAGIEFSPEEISLAKKEHKSEEYLKIHKFGQIPAWKEDDGTVFTESSSILRFIANKYNVQSLWPEDLVDR
jgi:glutathione S-transferase